MPGCQPATVRSIEQDSNVCSVARAGDNVAVILHGVDSSKLMPGGVICHPDFPVPMAARLELKILVLDVAVPILIGSQVCAKEICVLHHLSKIRKDRFLLILSYKKRI